MMRSQRSIKRVRYNEMNEIHDGPVSEPSLKNVLTSLGLQALAHNLPASRHLVSVREASLSDLKRCDNVLRQILDKLSTLLYPADPQTYIQTRFGFFDGTSLPCITKDIAPALKATKRDSVERRVLRAVLCSSMKRNSLNEFLEEASLHNSDGHVIDAGDSCIVISERIYVVARLDWDSLLINGKLSIRKRHVSRCDQNQVEFMVRFIFLRPNIQLLSWGTKRITINEKDYILPAVTRKKKRVVLYKEYLNTCDQHQEQALGRTTFFKTCSCLTARDSKRKSAIDYVVGSYVNDSILDLCRMVKIFVPLDERIAVNNQIECVEYFMKTIFLDSHVDRDLCGMHDNEFALRAKNNSDSHEEEIRDIECHACLAPFGVLNKLKAFIPSLRGDAVSMLDNIGNKFLLYFAHLHRVRAQQKALEKVFEDILQQKQHNRVVILADYKMKFEPIRYREKTADFFGKKGISWHGAVVFHLPAVYNSTDQYCGPDHLSLLFYDHIVQSDTQQDLIAVSSLLEACMMRLRIDLPMVTEAIILTDNAGCYQNTTLPLVLPFIAKRNGVALLRFMHTETQDGKSLVDAHFAIAMRHVCKIVSQGMDVTTPSSLATALRSGGGLKNSAAELVRIDRTHANLKAWNNLRGTAANGLPWIGRNNEYRYDGWSPDGSKVSVTCYKYSDHGEGRRCQFSRSGARKPIEMHLVKSWASVLSGREDDIQPHIHDNVERIGVETGVRVLSQAMIQSILSRRIVRSGHSRSRFFTAAEEITVEGETENGSQGGSGSESEEETGITCEKCQKRFTSEGRLLQHMTICDSHGGNEECRTVLGRAVALANHLIQTKEISIMSMKDEQILNDVNVSDLTIEKLKPGWSRREVKARKVPTYIEKHEITLQHLFQRGAADKSMKMGPSSMREHLLELHGDRFDIPTESDIQKYIQVLFSRQKNGSAAVRACRMPEVYREFVEDIVVENNYAIAPSLVVKLLKTQFNSENGLPQDFPATSQIKNRVSSLKTSHKRETSLPDDTNEHC